MKTYSKPITLSLHLAPSCLMKASGGVTSGSNPTNSFNSDDATYSRQHSGGMGSGLWEDMK